MTRQKRQLVRRVETLLSKLDRLKQFECEGLEIPSGTETYFQNCFQWLTDHRDDPEATQ